MRPRVYKLTRHNSVRSGNAAIIISLSAMGALKRRREELPHVRAERTPCPKGGGQEELPHVRGQGRWPRGDTQCLRSGAATRGVTPCPRSGAAAGRSNPTPKARGSGREDQPHAMAARAQEGLEELSHVEGQEGRQ